MRKYGKRHTFPYLLSLAIEYLAFSLRRTAANRLALNKSTGSMLPHTISEAEKAETKRRAMAFWLYVVRGPVWETFTKFVIFPYFFSTIGCIRLISFVSLFVCFYADLNYNPLLLDLKINLSLDSFLL